MPQKQRRKMNQFSTSSSSSSSPLRFSSLSSSTSSLLSSPLGPPGRLPPLLTGERYSLLATLTNPRTRNTRVPALEMHSRFLNSRRRLEASAASQDMRLDAMRLQVRRTGNAAKHLIDELLDTLSEDLDQIQIQARGENAANAANMRSFHDRSISRTMQKSLTTALDAHQRRELVRQHKGSLLTTSRSPLPSIVSSAAGATGTRSPLSSIVSSAADATGKSAEYAAAQSLIGLRAFGTTAAARPGCELNIDNAGKKTEPGNQLSGKKGVPQ